MPTSHGPKETVARIRELLNADGPTARSPLQRMTDELLLYHRDHLTERFVRELGPTVRTGPLAGLKIPEEAAWLPMLIGSYESELHPILERVMATRYRRIVDVGCALGYYAVGLARKMPGTTVFAFDIDSQARARCARTVAMNGVTGRVHIAGACDHARLEALSEPGTLVICDIEGDETKLLDPARAPGLARCDVLVECHDFNPPPASVELARRFGATHHVQLIPNTWVNPNRYPFLARLKPLFKFMAVWEGRPGLTPWLFLTSRQHPTPQVQ
jgi:hypothetical protein